ncbi:hypothetical protein JT359_15070 [Candidatus Poribacteria bacterium]|nr:hypothetical protein [Candidatus Poribacteria bacterium]
MLVYSIDEMVQEKEGKQIGWLKTRLQPENAEESSMHEVLTANIDLFPKSNVYYILFFI